MILNAKPIPFGIMAWWKGVEDAAAYHVSLFINDDRILRVETDRDTLCHSFTDLALISKDIPMPQAGPPQPHPQPQRGVMAPVAASVHERPTGLGYYVMVEAEDRDGEIIDSSGKCGCDVIYFRTEMW